tara:strand:+ start:756 stop:1010 length:255 start_codon:yes stop_codon:yes gene_type:complete
MKRISLVYGIINVSDINLIDFSQIGETNADTLRKNIAETQFVIKWNTEPSFISDGSVVPIGIYSHIEILELMATPEWSEEIPVE